MLYITQIAKCYEMILSVSFQSDFGACWSGDTQRHFTFCWRDFFSPPTIQALYFHMIKLFSATNYNHALLKIIEKKFSPGFTLVKEFIARLFF